MIGAEDARQVWVKRVNAWPALVLLIGVGTAQTLRRDGLSIRSILRLIAGTAVGGLFLTARVIASEDGLEVGFGPWGWPGRDIPIREITDVRVERGYPIPYLGMGYRFVGGGARVVLNRAEVLVVDLVGGRSFGVTVGGAESAAERIRAGLDREVVRTMED